MTISIRFTYQTVTQESAEYGDHDNAGFCDMYGNPITDNSDDLTKVNDFEVEQYEPGDLAYLIDKALELGINEPSCYPVTQQTIKYVYWSSVDGDTTYSLHIDGLLDNQKMKIHAMIKDGKLNYDYLDSIEA